MIQFLQDAVTAAGLMLLFVVIITIIAVLCKIIWIFTRPMKDGETRTTTRVIEITKGRRNK